VSIFSRVNRAQSRKLSDIMSNFGCFFALPSVVRAAIPKVVTQKYVITHYHTCLAPRRIVKFLEVTPTIPEVIGTHTLNFKLNLQCSPLKCVRGLCPSLGMCASNL